MFPSFITRIISASLIVDSLCATIKLVLPDIRREKACCIFCSVRVSIEEVASSRIRIGGKQSIMRAIHKSCFCPCDSAPPSSPITVSYPSGSCIIKLCAWESFAAEIISSSVASGLPKAIFSLTVPLFRHVSCNTMP